MQRAALLGVLFSVLPAHAAPPDAVSWLRKIADAATQQNYAGTYIYQYGNRVETFKITHLYDERGEHEKLEVLDDIPREIVRNNGEVLCFEGDAGAVVVEKRKFRKLFPALLPSQINSLLENYQIRMGDTGRVTGILCQRITLDPKDNYRYRHSLCADTASGLLLRASMINDRGEVLAQTTFTQLDIGGKIDKEQLKPKLSGRKMVIHSDKAVVTDAQQFDAAWNVTQLPAGFTRTMAVKRTMQGKEHPVNQLVFSDGLATVSVFIEPMAVLAKPVQGASSQGVINVYSRAVDGHQVTVLGEVPAATVAQIGNAVTHKVMAK
jgi:sigma-E factor negative regulatory protein RseB